MNIYRGILEINNFGFGIISNNDFKKKIRVDKKNLNNNISGETVTFEIIKENEFIIYAKILSDPNLNGKFFIGYFHHNYKKNTFIYNSKFGKSNLIMCDLYYNLEENDIIKFIITKYKNKKFYGKIKKKIGNINDNKSISKLIINEFNLNNTFSNKIIKEVLNIKNKYISELKHQKLLRKDLTNINTFTIDPKGARDLDDAISILKNNDIYIIYINIADVSYFVEENSFINKEALKRSFSVYLPSNVIRMLPGELSEDLCSLTPNSNKYAVTTEVHIDKNGKIIKYDIYKSIIKSNYKFTYKEVYDIITNNKNHFLIHELKLLYDVTKLLKTKRICLPEKNFNNKTKKYDIFFHDFSHVMIQELMILNNILASKIMLKKKIPYPNRYHPPIDNNLVSNCIKLINTYNDKDIEKFNIDNIQEIIKNNMDSNKNNILLLNMYVIQLIMSKASYKDNKNGHWALNLEYYSHFTSPIRRFSDILCHRIIFGKKKINNLSNILENINKKESKYQQIDFYLENLNILKNLKNNEKIFFSKEIVGIVTRISNPTINIFIPEIYWSKNIHISELSNVRLNYNEKENYFYNLNYEIKIGYEFKLKINKINIPYLEIKFEILNKIGL